MVCFFSRSEGIIRCEVRPVLDGDDSYELIIDRPDAMVQVERFSDAGTLNERWTDVEEGLLRQGWRGPAPLQHLKHFA